MAAIISTPQGWKFIRGSEDLLRVYPSQDAVESWAFLRPAERRDALVEMGLPRAFATQVMFQDGLTPSSVVYLSAGSAPTSGAIAFEDLPGPSRKKVLRTWRVGGRTVLRAYVHPPKNKGFELKTLTV